MEPEDLVAKVRIEAVNIMIKEKVVARKQKLANGDLCDSNSSSDGNKDYKGTMLMIRLGSI